MALDRGSLSLGAACLALLLDSLHAFAFGSIVTSMEVDTTVTLSAPTFWRLARSEDFYRSSRQHGGNVRQKVVKLSDWMDVDHTSSVDKPSTVQPPPVEGSLALLRPPPAAQDRLRRQQQLRREARLIYSITTPFGSSDADVVQEQELAVQDSGTICYTEDCCITGFPMMPGDLLVKTTFAVTPAEDDPESVHVRVGVVVEDLTLPKALRWLEARVKKIMQADGKNQAVKWLQEMSAAEMRDTDLQEDGPMKKPPSLPGADAVGR